MSSKEAETSQRRKQRFTFVDWRLDEHGVRSEARSHLMRDRMQQRREQKTKWLTSNQFSPLPWRYQPPSDEHCSANPVTGFLPSSSAHAPVQSRTSARYSQPAVVAGTSNAAFIESTTQSEESYLGRYDYFDTLHSTDVLFGCGRLAGSDDTDELGQASGFIPQGPVQASTLDGFDDLLGSCTQSTTPDYGVAWRAGNWYDSISLNLSAQSSTATSNSLHDSADVFSLAFCPAISESLSSDLNTITQPADSLSNEIAAFPSEAGQRDGFTENEQEATSIDDIFNILPYELPPCDLDLLQYFLDNGHRMLHLDVHPGIETLYHSLRELIIPAICHSVYTLEAVLLFAAVYRRKTATTLCSNPASESAYIAYHRSCVLSAVHARVSMLVESKVSDSSDLILFSLLILLEYHAGDRIVGLMHYEACRKYSGWRSQAAIATTNDPAYILGWWLDVTLAMDSYPSASTDPVEMAELQTDTAALFGFLNECRKFAVREKNSSSARSKHARTFRRNSVVRKVLDQSTSVRCADPETSRVRHVTRFFVLAHIHYALLDRKHSMSARDGFLDNLTAAVKRIDDSKHACNSKTSTVKAGSIYAVFYALVAAKKLLPNNFLDARYIHPVKRMSSKSVAKLSEIMLGWLAFESKGDEVMHIGDKLSCEWEQEIYGVERWRKDPSLLERYELL